MPPEDLPHPSFDVDALPAHALRIGTRNIWLAYDSYAEPDMLTAYVELGPRETLDLALTLNLLLGLCLEVDGAARGSVVRHPQTGQMIYRFRYALDDDPEATDLLDAIAALTAELDGGGAPTRY
ncbi:hypothetical protein [Ralstonia sp. Ralssp110]|uniref:hypothetical protein n=1 Tax=Ralstonia sp. Ralssp110 TaxID=3243004 RepID=UPI0039B61BD8